MGWLSYASYEAVDLDRAMSGEQSSEGLVE